MTNQEAIERAHAAICEESLEDCLDPDWRGRCVKAVEAAAPFLRARALEDAADKIVVTIAPSLFITDKPETIMSIIGREQANWLAARAATERGQG